MSKAQEKRDQLEANRAWNVKAQADYRAREVTRAFMSALEEAGDAYEANGGGIEAATTREEMIYDNAKSAGEAEGRADALINRADDERSVIEDMIDWITYRHPDTTMTTLDVLETMLDQVNA